MTFPVLCESSSSISLSLSRSICWVIDFPFKLDANYAKKNAGKIARFAMNHIWMCYFHQDDSTFLTFPIALNNTLKTLTLAQNPLRAVDWPLNDVNVTVRLMSVLNSEEWTRCKNGRLIWVQLSDGAKKRKWNGPVSLNLLIDRLANNVRVIKLQDDEWWFRQNSH